MLVNIYVLRQKYQYAWLLLKCSQYSGNDAPCYFSRTRKGLNSGNRPTPRVSSSGVGWHRPGVQGASPGGLCGAGSLRGAAPRRVGRARTCALGHARSRRRHPSRAACVPGTWASAAARMTGVCLCFRGSCGQACRTLQGQGQKAPLAPRPSASGGCGAAVRPFAGGARPRAC